MSCDSLPAFEDIEVTGNVIQRAASVIQGSAGPGGCDASHWQDALLRYGAQSSHMRDQVASVARRLANSIVPWSDIRGFVASRLIALDKNPGVRPIGVGESLRRIVGKAIASLTKCDIEDVCGVSQLCSGLRAGIEGGVHAVTELFESEGWGLTHPTLAVLWNSRVLWPHCSRFLFNTYRGWAPLVLKGSPSLLYSKEGVTQGDPLSMLIYAIGSFPLINSLNHPLNGSQVWYADDASACAKLVDLKNWFLKLMQNMATSPNQARVSLLCLLTIWRMLIHCWSLS